MEWKDNTQPSTNRYARRVREKSEKGKVAEKLAADKKKRKRRSKVQNNCKACSNTHEDEAITTCIICLQHLHIQCAGLISKEDYYCTDCLNNLAWDAVEDMAIDIPRNAKKRRTAAQIEQNRQRALKILESKHREYERPSQHVTPRQLELELNRQNSELLKEIQELTILCTPLQQMSQMSQSSMPKVAGRETGIYRQ